MRTLALVIGNNSYIGEAKLTNANNDAKVINEVFQRLGFDTIFKLDCSTEDYNNLLSEFEIRLKDYDASLFFYAGHGFEYEGENFLPSIDCQIPPENRYVIGTHSIRLSELLDIYRKYDNKINIAIIDACRKSFERGGSVDLAPMSAPRGTLLAFSTSPNEGASDTGYEGHSIYTGALLQYLGREHLSVEDLFKKVRKTVYAISEGRKTTWEHTSLINDFYFNSGQLVHSLKIPYSSIVIKDIDFEEISEFGELIDKIKTYDWNVQNPAIDKVLKLDPSKLDKNQLFILGRNLLQASGAANSAVQFIENIRKNIGRYTFNDENHLLNGILYEIYFNTHGEFRYAATKRHHYEKILALRKDSTVEKSFEFISKLLIETGYDLVYIPSKVDNYIDIDIVAQKEIIEVHGNEVEYQMIHSITFNSINLLEHIQQYYISGVNELGLIHALSNFFTAPPELIKLHSPIELKKIAIMQSASENDDW